MCIKFRNLRPDEIEIRVAQVKDKGAQFLLYKDARCDMNILDESVGPDYWQRKHEEHNGNLFCSVGIFNKETDDWIWKEDAGAESNTEAEKGHASDSFKRACVNWGIGRELYTSPFIWISGCTEKNNSGKTVLSRDFQGLRVADISYDEKGSTITSLSIVTSRGDEVYTYGKKKPAAKPPKAPEKPKEVKQESPVGQTESIAQTAKENKDGYYTCECCGEVIGHFKNMTPKDVALLGLYKYGKQVCLACGKKLGKEKNA